MQNTLPCPHRLGSTRASRVVSRAPARDIPPDLSPAVKYLIAACTERSAVELSIELDTYTGPHAQGIVEEALAHLPRKHTSAGCLAVLIRRLNQLRRGES